MHEGKEVDGCACRMPCSTAKQHMPACASHSLSLAAHWHQGLRRADTSLNQAACMHRVRRHTNCAAPPSSYARNRLTRVGDAALGFRLLRPPPLFQEQHRSVTDCATTKPEECEALRYALFACRRGQVDARTRIQGNKGY